MMKIYDKKLAYPYFIWMVLFTVVPLIIVVYYALTDGNGNFTIANLTSVSGYGSVFARSLLLALVATVICLIIAFPVGYFLSRLRVNKQHIMLMLVMLPMWMNFLLRTYAWMSILENNGFINQFFRFIGLIAFLQSHFGYSLDYIPLINTQGAIVLGMVYNYLSFMIMPIYTVIEKTDHSLLEAAADLGASPVQSFLRVTLPYSLPGVLEGITMVFVPAVTTFVISQLMGGGKVPLIGDIIQNQFGKSSDWHFGSTLSLLVMVVVLAFMGGLQRIDKEEEPQKEVRIL